ncbi:MAG: four helix bundle protein [Candidatus Peribacteraceae bacterium]|jgi:four helix bundle protein
MLQLPFKKLKIWEKGMNLAKEVYKISKNFPKEELYGITSQIRRSAVSIPSNISEGSQRTSNKEFANFILIAKGSLAELETQLLLAKDFGYIEEKDMDVLQEYMSELGKMLYAFHRKLITDH